MAVKDLVSGVLAESITTSTTNVLVTIAQSIGRPGILSFFPTPPFYITIMPKSPAVGVANRLDSEILQVTAVGNDQVGNAALTCVRGQRDTTAKAFEAGSIVTVGVYTDDAVLLGGTGTTETETPWIDTGDIVDGAVTSGKIDWSTLTQSFSSAKSYFRIGNLLIYYGGGTKTCAGSNDSTVNITFSPAYADTNYRIIVGCAFNDANHENITPAGKIVSTTSATLNFWNKGSAAVNYRYSYIVIGKGA